MLNNIKSKQSGFTIVELLIVIVVIAILAAISIVAYNGIQNRGKASAAQSLANSVVKKAEAFNTVDSVYPTRAVFAANNGNGTQYNSAEAKLDDITKVLDGNATTPVYPTDEKAVSYRRCSTSGTVQGAQVIWWNPTAPSGNSTKLVLIGLGGAASTAADATTAPTPCTAT